MWAHDWRYRYKSYIFISRRLIYKIVVNTDLYKFKVSNMKNTIRNFFKFNQQTFSL